MIAFGSAFGFGFVTEFEFEFGSESASAIVSVFALLVVIACALFEEAKSLVPLISQQNSNPPIGELRKIEVHQFVSRANPAQRAKYVHSA